MSDVVWWTSGGRVLHRDPDCPPFLRARARAIARFHVQDWTGPELHSFDFDESTGSEGNGTYPPESWGLCGLCFRRPAKSTYDPDVEQAEAIAGQTGGIPMSKSLDHGVLVREEDAPWPT